MAQTKKKAKKPKADGKKPPFEKAVGEKMAPMPEHPKKKKTKKSRNIGRH